MNSREKISEAKIPTSNRSRVRNPPSVTNTNEIQVTAPAVFRLSRMPANIAEKICAAPVSALM